MAWQRATAIPAGLARRGRILLLLADGVAITDVADTVGISRKHIYKWIQRFVQEGVAGLTDRPKRRHWSRLRRPDRPEAPDVDRAL